MTRKSRSKPFEAIAFTNDLGHLIVPGDTVVAVVKGGCSIGTYQGRYLGLRHQKGWNNQEWVTTVIETDHKREIRVHNETGEEWSYDTYVPGLVKPERPDRFNWGLTSWQRAENRAANDAWFPSFLDYQKAFAAYELAINNYLDANYHQVTIPYTVRRTLQLNRIYPLRS